MKIDFVINNYLIIWNLLFGPSISIKAHAFKQRLWLTYNKEYKVIESDKTTILRDMKNFIPDDNTLYNKIEGTLLFDRLIKDANIHRLELLKIWDSYKKEINNNLKKIVRCDSSKYNVLVLPSYMDTIIREKKTTNIAWGKKQDLNDKLYTILSIVSTLINHSDSNNSLTKKITDSVYELAITNEIYTRMNGKSNNLDGSKDFKNIKRDIYPYFLMYLGVEQDNFTEYMMRDKLAFEIDDYPYNDKLKDMNIDEFIEFIIKNRKTIIKSKKLGLDMA